MRLCGQPILIPLKSKLNHYRRVSLIYGGWQLSAAGAWRRQGRMSPRLLVHRAAWRALITSGLLLRGDAARKFFELDVERAHVCVEARADGEAARVVREPERHVALPVADEAARPEEAD